MDKIQVYANRLAGVRKYMEDHGLNGALFTSYENRRYFSGFTGSNGASSRGPSMVTMSGVVTDKTLCVLDADQAPIAGLYAAGNDLGGRYGTGYSTPCAGSSIGMAGTHGRLAGQFVVEDN